ncbi:hypothetical protein ACFY2H_38155 [Streptomyces griseofuscus]|uniref:hypothetical protein n=1 Tax=Streptomyces griseofuscus TaxID=146922 RepID=UPI00367B81A8
MSELARGIPSKTTFERAASGSGVPAWETVERYVELTMTKEEGFTGSMGAALRQARRLWIKARRATRAPYYLHKAPDPALIGSKADFSRALRDLHIWAGCPTPGEMESMSPAGALPKTTAYRIINGRALPIDSYQLMAFLTACEVPTLEGMEPWLEAAARAFVGYPSHRNWVEMHIWIRDKIKTAETVRASFLENAA